MALNFASMLLQPTKTSAWDLAPDGSSSARENLKLLREKFDWEKKRAVEEDRLEREKAAAAMAKARLEAEEAKAAKLQEQRLAAYTEFTKQAGVEGNAQALHAQAPLLRALGMGVELEGETGGLPRYRIDMDAAAAEKEEAARAAQTSPYGEGETAEQSLSRLGAMGLGGETGSLLPPLGIRSSDEVEPGTGLSVADRVAATYGMPGEKTPRLDPTTGEPMRETEDFMGGVPQNVIDMGAMAAATLHGLDPALKGAVAAYPDAETRAGAEQIRLGLRGSGLPLGKQLEAFDKAISGPASQRNAQIGADAQAERFRETRDELTEPQKFQIEKAGRDDADKFATDNKIYEIGKALDAGATILDVIDEPGADDAMIASELMTFQNVKGTPSDTDLKLAFGIPFASTLDQALDTISKMVKGGMGPVQREAIKNYIGKKTKELEGTAIDYLDRAHTRAGPAYNERAKAPYLETIKGSVKGYLYNRWLDMKKERDEGAGGDRGKKTAELSAPGKQHDPDDIAQMSDIELELEGQALEAGLDPEQIRPLMRTESGGDPTIKNKKGSSASGLFQFTDDTAKRYGLKDAAAYAALPPEKQIELAVRRFKDIGLDENSTRDDYALANAAPAYVGKSDDTVIEEYKAGTAFGDDVRAKNPGWIPPGGGEITVGSIKAFYRGGKGKGAATKLPEPKTPAEKRYLELLKKRGG